MAYLDLQQWIEHPENLNKETLYELRNLLVRYPYCQTLRLLFLKNLYLLRDISFGMELRNSVLYVGDRRVLFYLIEGEKYTLAARKKEFTYLDELKEEPGLDRTLSLIDAFLSNMPQDNSLQDNFNLTSDYTTYLMQSRNTMHEVLDNENISEIPQLRGQDLIDSFIIKSENEPMMLIKPSEESENIEDTSEEPVSEELVNEIFTAEGDDDIYFTETLAKIYVKQRRYSKAIEIIKKLSLKYPKKSTYFAYQIRYLEKLIINAKSK